MIPPRKVKFEAKKRENENLRFRTFLKCNADAEELDKQFADLHKEIFSGYDCSRCRNCCKEYRGEILSEDIKIDAEFLHMTEAEFIEQFLEKVEYEEKYQTKNCPCDFLKQDGNCMLGDCKPENCKRYPYTDQPDRLESLFGMIDSTGVCPVAFEIWEKLKKIYEFK